MPTISCVLLDFGQVISKPQSAQPLARLRQLAQMEVAAFDAAYYRYRYDYDQHLLDSRAYWHKVLSHSPVDPTDQLVAELTHCDILSWMEVDQRILTWVETVNQAGFTSAILSNMPMDSLHYYRKHCPWLALFAKSFFSCEFKLVKPDPAIYQQVLAGLNLAATEILFVDDRAENIDAARALGFNGIHYQSIEDLITAAPEYKLPIPNR